MKATISILTKKIAMIKVLFIVGILASCNKDFPNILKEQGEQPKFTTGSSKVLYIIADGIRGKAMQQVEQLPNFRVIARNSLYSFGSLGDYSNAAFSKETGLTNLLTGVTNAKHKVVGNDFSKADLVKYPSILSRINSKSSDFSSIAFTSNAALSTSLLKDADKNVLVQSDEELITKAKEELTKGSSDFVVANLTNIYTVGLANSFSETNTAYLNALKKFDQQVGDLINAIKTREAYAQENWLVIITSSIGGVFADTEIDNTRFGDTERNTITYFYSPKFARGLLVRPNSTQIPFEGNAVKYTYSAGTARAEAKIQEAYNYDGTTDFTVNFFYKQSNTSIQNWPVILNKRESFDGGSGWQVLLSEGQPELTSSFSGKIKGGKINDALWHSVTVVVSRSGSADSSKIFVDGVLGAKTTANANAITTIRPLSIGKVESFNYNNADFMMANLQIYKGVAWTDQEVKKYHGLTEINDDNMPYFDNLEGYWPGYADIGTNKLTDMSPLKNDMTLAGPYSWLSYSDIVGGFQPPITEAFYKLVPNSVDLPFFIYQWFGMIPVESWGLDGKSWTPKLLVSEN